MITQSAPMPYLLNSKSKYMVQFLPKHTVAWPLYLLFTFLVHAFKCTHLPLNFELVSYLFAFESVADLLWWWLQQVPRWRLETADKTSVTICHVFAFVLIVISTLV